MRLSQADWERERGGGAFGRIVAVLETFRGLVVEWMGHGSAPFLATDRSALPKRLEWMSPPRWQVIRALLVELTGEARF